ncbi:prepilin peptidase [Mesorhizobium sp. KR9-304]|uniref:prepilin peptidase n=1 Tax=Mesorhizobium sp. KR9-304 TaxID=3156614 RepID=UPI0032B48A7A
MLLALSIGLKLVLIAALGKIGFLDFTLQKIRNNDVLAVVALSAAVMIVGWLAGEEPWRIGLGIVAALVLFCLLIPFWIMGKVGAGDVKFMAAAPLVTGGGDLLLFSIVLLIAAILTAFVVKNPLLLAEGMFRGYIQHLGRKQVVPFGVPISAGLIVVLLLQLVRAGSAMV